MRELEGKRNNANNWAFGNIELSMEIDSLNTISAYSNLNSHRGGAETDQVVTTTYINAPPDISYLYTENEHENLGVSVGTDYIRKFKKNKESEISFRFFGEFGEANAEVNSTVVQKTSISFFMRFGFWRTNCCNSKITCRIEKNCLIDKPFSLKAKFKRG